MVAEIATQTMVNTNIASLKSDYDTDGEGKRWRELGPALAEFISDEGTVVGSIVVEVWLSSLWSAHTRPLFVSASARVLQDTNLEPRVRAIVDWWKRQASISRSAALKFQLAHVCSDMEPKFAVHACALLSKRDRTDYLRYHRTKARYEGPTADTVGSVTMCTSNARLGIKQHFGDVLESCPPAVYCKMHNRNLDGNLPLFATIRAYFEQQITTYANMIRRGTLTFTPTLSCVSLENESLIQEINSLNLFVIHWSNIIAKRMSGPDTVHYVHSCNWYAIFSP